MADLFPAGEEECIGIHSIADCASQEGNPMEDNGWFFLVANEQLARDIQDYRNEQRCESVGACNSKICHPGSDRRQEKGPIDGEGVCKGESQEQDIEGVDCCRLMTV